MPHGSVSAGVKRIPTENRTNHVGVGSNLMAKDEFKNLGFQDPAPKPSETEKGVKGELRW